MNKCTLYPLACKHAKYQASTRTELWFEFLSIRILCNATRHFVLTLDKISSRGAGVYLLCDYSKKDFEPQRRRALERRAFVAHKLLLLQPQQVAVVRLGSLCPSSHTAKNFAFIFDIQAQVRLFLPCGSPCVRSTSACAVLLRSRRTKRSGTAFSRFVLQTLRMPFVACNELAIATKSIASVCPHANDG